jgi:hypothetical protein
MVGVLLRNSIVSLAIMGAAVFAHAPEAKAQFGLPGGVVNRILNNNIPVPRGLHSRNSSGESSSNSRRRRGGTDDSPPERTSAQQNLTESQNFARAEAERQQIEAANRMESDRNVENAIKSFIEDLRGRHANLLGKNRNVNVATGLDINQVTAGQVRAAVEDAYKQARLYEFERLAGEMWTRDRLMVLALRHARKSLAPYFDGAGAKGPSMSDISDVLSKSAKSVYAKALETGEIIGVSHSFDRFIRTIYEQSDRSPEGLWTTGADGRYERMMSTVIDSVPREVFSQQASTQVNDALGLERQFQYRFRARRALYDCLAANYGDLTNGGTIAVAAKAGPSGKGEPSRGIRIEAMQPPAKASEVATVVSVSESGGVWVRAEKHVKTVCKTAVITVVKMTTDGEIHPQPARFDTTLVGGNQGITRDVAPVGLPTQR